MGDAAMPDDVRQEAAYIGAMSEPTPAPNANDDASSPETAAPQFNADVPHAARDRPLTAVARRALEEAAVRRAAAAAAELATEHGGPRGPEPTRYGDWEKKGLAVDF